MAEKDKKPEIRFKGFGDDWKELRLGDIADITGGGTPSTNNLEYWNGDIDWYSPTEIGKEIYADGSSQKITALGLEKSSARILPADKTVLFSSRAGIGDMAILKRSGSTNQGFQSFVLKDGINPYFIYSAGHLIKEYALKHASGSTFLEISGKVLGNMHINIPSTYEQTEIGIFFKNLDQYLTLHQSKYNKLVNVKKAMLEKMFPQNGAYVPEIRFKGFTGNWEENKLEDLCSIITKQTGFDYTAVIKPSLLNKQIKNSYSFIQNKDFNGININLNTSFYIPKDIAETFPRILIDKPSILISISGKIGNVGFYQLQNKAFIGGAVGICKLINNSDGLLILYALLSDVGQGYFQSLTKASSHLNITVEDIRKITIQMPKSDEEKEKVGSFFKNLDDLLTLHKSELEKLRNIKKSMLEKMFV